ncbi:hypothetical protein FOA52_005315 [Chlamydomonas sp. UWO 241]|nr:hypothetical protein FOA52_005315 [Chlamydomonas sp. UWO 241]
MGRQAPASAALGGAGSPMPGRAGSMRAHAPCGTRTMSSLQVEIDKEVEAINNLFVEARDEIEFAAEDSETTYFNDSVEEAKKVVDECVGKFDALVARLPGDEASKLQRSMGLKMQQLKAEFEILRKTHLEEH